MDLTDCPLCKKPCGTDAKLLQHLQDHSWKSDDLMKLIKWIHERFEPSDMRRKGFRPWGHRKGGEIPKWWYEAADLREKGWFLQSIGDYFKLSRERIRQVLKLFEKEKACNSRNP